MAAATTSDAREQDSTTIGTSLRASVFHWVTSATVLVAFRLACGSGILSGLDLADIGAWVIAALAADLMFVRIGRSVTLSMSLPVLLAAALVHPPMVTAMIAFLGCLDPREWRRQCSIERIFFNRSQVAISAAAASAAMHAVPSDTLAWPVVVGVAFVGLSADCVTNVAFVTLSNVLSGRGSGRATLRGLWGSEPTASLGLYASMCVLAPLLALIYGVWGPWALLAGTAFLLPCRLALVRIERLHTTSDILRLKDAALQKASTAAGLERRHERLTLAGDLHDEVLPALFQVHLMGQVLKQDLEAGRLLELDDDLPKLLEATGTAQEAVRRVVGELRTSNIGSRGVARAIRSCAGQLETEGRPRFDLQLEEVQGCEASEMTLFQVAREAMTNASKYSRADRIRVRLSRMSSGWAELLVVDDGSGFGVEGVDQRTHFGIQLMRERVEQQGGWISISSVVGHGTRVTARIPLRASPNVP
jgi:signal transduction histidine kinase